jgi:cytochrome P450
MQGMAPPGPDLPYDNATGLLHWLKRNHDMYGDLYAASIYGNKVYVVSSPEYCEHIFRRNWKNYPRKGLVVQRIALALGNNLITSNGDSWAKQRRMIQPAFTKDAVARSYEMIAEANGELLCHWKEAAKQRKVVNVTRDVSLMTLKITLFSIFGADYETVATQFKYFAEDAERGVEFALTLAPLKPLILELIERRRFENIIFTDTLGVMMQARSRESGAAMPDAQMVREVLNLVVAGHETTASLLNWLWYLLATHPAVHARLAREYDALPWDGPPPIDAFPKYTYTRQVIDEALRLYPPLWLMSRKALKNDLLGQYFVPAGTEIYISPHLIQRNPNLWEIADQFDPDCYSDRTNARHELAACPFGAGPRKCIGDFLARIEIQTHLMMFGKLLHLRYSGAEPLAMAAGLNLLTEFDLNMLPEMRISSDGVVA